MADSDLSDEELAELEAELQREMEAELAAKAAAEAALNANATNQTLNDNATNILGDSGNAQFDGGAQLTTFQDNIITTGSDVSILLMVLLLILFIVQMIRKTYAHFTLQSQLQAVENPIDSAKPMAAENLNPMNPAYSHTSFAVYNTEFEERKLYLLKKAEGAPLPVLKDILLKRAIKAIEKARAIQRDGQGIRKNWNMDLLPREVWHDYQAAQRNLNLEIENVVQESKACGFHWGPRHGDNIFSQAREHYDKKVGIQNQVFKQKMMRQKQAQQRANGAKAPNAKSFGNGLAGGFLNRSASGSTSPNSSNNSRNNSSSKKMTRKERNAEREQKKRASQPVMQEGTLQNPNNAGQVRRRKKPKHRFKNK